MVPAADAPRALAIGADAVVPDGEGLGERLVTVIAALLARRAGSDGPGRAGPGGNGPSGGARADAAPLVPDDPGSLLAPDGRLVVVWSGHGAPGRSVTAVNVAAELALHGPTMLVDADSVAPSLTQVLGVVEETAGLAALCRAAGQGVLETVTVLDRARRLPSGVLLLPGLTRADRWRELVGDHLDLVWPALRRSAAWVVVDVAAGLEPAPQRGADRWAATRSALRAADDVVVVAGSDPVGLRRAVGALAELDAEEVAAPRHLVTTRVRGGRRAGADAAVARAVERFAGVPPVVGVPQEDAFDDALLAGAALREAAPRSAARRSYAALADHLRESGAPEATTEVARVTARGPARRSTGRRRGREPRPPGGERPGA
ncbi:hypothetical protein [Litorihabitans aurantiacus]|uniref:hypothetical protein n=1 Tax=Litorihabitans aurantiacus TaxID=1930061 RepID=UPI0024E1974D|nr:hypothetical protein [Litorihabitans aurantiacus]